MKPIPLTEEWLIRAGFNNSALVKDSESQSIIGLLRYWNNEDQEVYYSDVKSYYQIAENNCMSYGISPILKDIKYIHQLQNIYYALKGKELEIKQ